MHTFFKHLSCIILLNAFVLNLNLFAQDLNESAGLTLQVSQEQDANILNATLKFVNKHHKPFNGFLMINTPLGIKSITDHTIPIEILAGATKFSMLKFIIQRAIPSGDKHIEFTILDEHKNPVFSTSIKHQVKEVQDLRIYTNNPVYYVTNPNDSVVIDLNVVNLGSMAEDISVVFSIPDLKGERNFFEQKARIEVGRDSVFKFRFLPSMALLEKNQFLVNIAAMRGSEKALLGSLSVSVQNVSSSKRYIESSSVVSNSFPSQNSIKASFRSMDNAGQNYQLMGSGIIDLPAGLILLNGDVYKSSYQQKPTISNTYLEYHLDNHALRIGSIMENLEMSLYGTGAKVKLEDKLNHKSLEFGFLNQDYELLSNRSYLQNGYSMFVRGGLGKIDQGRSYGTYILNYNALEQVQHHLISADFNKKIKQIWNFTMKVHGALSDYRVQQLLKPTFATEAQYQGQINGTQLSGHYYVSSDFFPGNRRGMLQLHQSLFRKFNSRYALFANVMYADLAPKFMNNRFDSKTKNFRAELGLSFPELENFKFSAGLQNQIERASMSFILPGDFQNVNDDKIIAHRLQENITFISPNKFHSISLNIENGLVKHSRSNRYSLQFRINNSYVYRWLNLNTTYQYGGFYVSEFMYENSLNDNFKRFTFNMSINQNFIQDKLQLQSGLSYVDDFSNGSAPSVFLNLRFNPNQIYSVYLNSYWYKYKTNKPSILFRSNHVFTVEAGLVFNFAAKGVSKGRKAKVLTKVYYDRNNNNVFDDGDSYAKDYYVNLNHNAFKTDSLGQFVYKGVPFGTYELSADNQTGWYTDGMQVKVDRYRNEINVPLRRNGALNGRIKYDFEASTALNFEPKLAGVMVQIYRKGKLIQKIQTNDSGEYSTFLPADEYQVVLDEGSLATNTYCENSTRLVKVEVGSIVKLPGFVIKVKKKNINMKRFGN